LSEIKALAVKNAFLGDEIFVSREIRDVAAANRYGEVQPGYREYMASSSVQPSFVIRVMVIKNAPKPKGRTKVHLIDPQVTYITERNANGRSIDVPIVVVQNLELEEDK
jgi:hypothetical protein